MDKNGQIVALIVNDKLPEKHLSTDDMLDGIQTLLDLSGLIPGFGEIFDGINAVIYLTRGNYINAGLSGISAIPFVGWFGTGGKLGRKAVKAVDKTSDAAKVINKSDNVVKGVAKSADDIDASAGSKAIKFDSLDDFVNNPKKLDGMNPTDFHTHLSKNGYNPTPLSKGSTGGIPFEQGGGFRVN